MSSENSTRRAAMFLGVELPAGVVLHVNAHGLTIEQCEQVAEDAIAAGLLVREKTFGGSRWLEIEPQVSAHRGELCVFLPDVHSPRCVTPPFDERIEIVEQVPPSAEVQLQDDCDQSLLAAAPAARMFGGEQ